mgnify:CR=1 FL=1
MTEGLSRHLTVWGTGIYTAYLEVERLDWTFRGGLLIAGEEATVMVREWKNIVFKFQGLCGFSNEELGQGLQMGKVKFVSNALVKVGEGVTVPLTGADPEACKKTKQGYGWE